MSSISENWWLVFTNKLLLFPKLLDRARLHLHALHDSFIVALKQDSQRQWPMLLLCIIHIIHRPNCFWRWGSQGCWSLSQLSLGQDTQVANSSQGQTYRQTVFHSPVPTYNSAVNLMGWMQSLTNSLKSNDYVRCYWYQPIVWLLRIFYLAMLN